MIHAAPVIVAGEWLMVALAFATPLSTAAVNALVFALMGCWLVAGQWKKHLKEALSHTLVRGFLVLFMLMAVSAIYSIAPPNALWTGLREALKWWLLPLFLLFSHSKKTLQRALMAFVLAMILTLILGFLKWFGILAIGLKFSAAAVFKNHIITSYFMAFAAFCLAHYAVLQPKYRWLTFSIVATMIFYLFFMSAGRTGYVLAIVLGLIFSWQQGRWRGFLMALPTIILVVGLAAHFSDTFATRFLRVSQELHAHGADNETSLGLRLEFAKISVSALLDHPWIGQGVGSFKTVYQAKATEVGYKTTRNPHNSYLYIGIELGLLGLIALLFLWHRLIQCTAQLLPPYQAIAQGFVWSFIIGCAGNNVLVDFSERHFFSWMTALLFASVPSMTKKFKKPEVVWSPTLH